jgi:hypothetical protein
LVTTLSDDRNSIGKPKTCARQRVLLVDLALDNKNKNENKKKTLQAVIAIKEKVGTLNNYNNSSGKTGSQAAYLKP